jgi:hypothetical protein
VNMIYYFVINTGKLSGSATGDPDARSFDLGAHFPPPSLSYNFALLKYLCECLRGLVVKVPEKSFLRSCGSGTGSTQPHECN